MRTSLSVAKTENDMILDCALRKSLDSLHFLIGGRGYSFEGDEYFVPYPPAVVESDPRYYKGLCYLSAHHVKEESVYPVIGIDFMRKYYTVFHYGSQSPRSSKIGFGIAI